MRKRAMGLEFTKRKRDGVRVDHEKNSDKVRVDDEKRGLG